MQDTEPLALHMKLTKWSHFISSKWIKQKLYCSIYEIRVPPHLHKSINADNMQKHCSDNNAALLKGCVVSAALIEGARMSSWIVYLHHLLPPPSLPHPPTYPSAVPLFAFDRDGYHINVVFCSTIDFTSRIKKFNYSKIKSLSRAKII